MALLQVRNFPEDKYAIISRLAKEERRSIAQQTVLLIEKGLTGTESPSERRQRAIDRTMTRAIPEGMKNIDFAALIREDRER